MSVYTTTQPQRSLADLVRQHPLVAYFVLAFAGTWLFFAPITLSQRGLGWWPVELPAAVVFFLYFLATYTGPFLAAFVVTGLVDGAEGRRKLWRGIVQWRVGLRPYVILLVGYPAVILLGVAVLVGEPAFAGLRQNWPLIFTVYLPSILFGLFFPSLGEETGWRGFALPRLQVAYGPLLGSLWLGVLHALWHLPAYPVRGLFSEAGWDTTLFLANSLAIILVTLVWTWLFNMAGGSIFFAILIHATSNASSTLVPQWLNVQDGDPWALAKIAGVTVLLLILATRGRLGYRGEER